jgi:hypothetical protein
MGTVVSCAIGGCADTPTLHRGRHCSGTQLAIDQVNPGGLALGASNIYWANFTNGSRRGRRDHGVLDDRRQHGSYVE